MLKVDISRKKILLIGISVITFPFGCMFVNYILLSLSWLGRYLGTFIRLLYALVS